METTQSLIVHQVDCLYWNDLLDRTCSCGARRDYLNWLWDELTKEAK